MPLPVFVSACFGADFEFEQADNISMQTNNATNFFRNWLFGVIGILSMDCYINVFLQTISVLSTRF
jgi:hypothetical protein